jgi:hypothetical protein
LHAADATGTQASRLHDIAASADVSLRIVESSPFHAFGSRGVAGETPAFQSHPPRAVSYQAGDFESQATLFKFQISNLKF